MYMTLKNAFSAVIVCSTTVLLADALVGLYVADTSHSQVAFSVPVAGGLAHLGGRFNDFEVHINYNPNNLSRSSVKAVIQVKSLDTGVPGRDNHTLGKEGFYASKYPTITFESTRIEKSGANFNAIGNLTLRGVTKPITVPFRQTGTRPLGEKMSLIGFEGQFRINRRDYGLNWQFPGSKDWIGNTIDISISILARPM